MSSKIKNISEIAATTEKLKTAGKKIVHCHGVFDIIHPGHIRHLESAKKEGDILIVSITPDRFVNKGPGRPVFTQELRAEVLASLQTVDYVVINEWPTAVEIIKAIKPHVYVKGNDYKDANKDITGKISEEEAAIQSVGGQITFTNEITFSSSSIANNYLKLHSQEASSFLKDFRSRITEEDIIKSINKVASCKVLVMGDSIIDEYHYCSPMGKSPKENVIVTRYLSEEIFAGGVLAAANHLASLCNKVDLLTCLGKEDSRENFIQKNLKPNVSSSFFYQDKAPTIIKRRFVEPAYVRKLFEICFMNGELLPSEIEQELYTHLEKILPNYDLVLVTDFGHGFMTPKLIDLVCKKSKFLAVNAQSNSSNMGYNLITKYPRADYVCIDEPEARLALHDRTSHIEEIIKRLYAQLNAAVVTITRGNRGCTIFSNEQGFTHIPVLTSTVLDTVGAGDAFLSISSPCVASRIPIEQAGFIGNVAGALKVGIVGNKSSVEKVSLLKFISTLLK